MNTLSAQDEIRKRLARLQENLYAKSNLCYVGNTDGYIYVTERPGYIYVQTADSPPIEVYNARVQPTLGMPVLVGIDPLEPWLLQVLSSTTSSADAIAGTTQTVPTGTVGPHSYTHRFSGSDPTWSDKRQFMPGRIGATTLYDGAGDPTSAIAVEVYPDVLLLNNAPYELPYQTVDLSSYVPASGSSCYVCISVDASGSAAVTVGSTVAGDTPDLTDAPSSPIGGVALGYVRLYGGMTEVNENDDYTDILDTRFSAISSAGTVTAQIVLTRYNGIAVNTYPVSVAGLTAALAAAHTGDSVTVPPAVIAGDFVVPDGVTMVGVGRFASAIHGQVTIGDGTVLFTISIYHADNSAGGCTGIVGPDSGTAYVMNCGVLADQSGTGTAYGITGMNGNLSVQNTRVEGVAVSGNSYGYYASGSGLYEQLGGILHGTTESFYTTDLYNPYGSAQLNAVHVAPGMLSIPLASDRSAWDVGSYATLHASDIYNDACMRHTPVPGAVGTVPVSYGGAWVPQYPGGYVAVAIKGGDYELTEADQTVIFSASAIATLPAATGSGKNYRIVNRAGSLTITAASGETVKGAPTQFLYPGEDLILTDTETGVWE